MFVVQRMLPLVESPLSCRLCSHNIVGCVYHLLGQRNDFVSVFVCRWSDLWYQRTQQCIFYIRIVCYMYKSTDCLRGVILPAYKWMLLATEFQSFAYNLNPVQTADTYKTRQYCLCQRCERNLRLDKTFSKFVDRKFRNSFVSILFTPPTRQYKTRQCELSIKCHGRLIVQKIVHCKQDLLAR